MSHAAVTFESMLAKNSGTDEIVNLANGRTRFPDRSDDFVDLRTQRQYSMVIARSSYQWFRNRNLRRKLIMKKALC